MSLEEKIGNSFFSKAKSLLAKAAVGMYLATVPVVGGCGSVNIVGRRVLRTEWTDSKPLREKVIRSDIRTSGAKKTQTLADRIHIDYGRRRIAVPVSEQVVKYRTRVDVIQKQSVAREMKVEELQWKDTGKNCGTYMAIWGGLAGVSIISGFVIGDKFGETLAGAGGIIGGLGMGLSLIGECQTKTWTTTNTTVTGREKVKRRRVVKKKQLSPEILGTTPARSGTITVSGEFLPERSYPIHGGKAIISIPALKYPYFLADNRNSIGNSVSISSIKPACRSGVLEYIASESGMTSAAFTVQTNPPANAREDYETDRKTYSIKLFKAPSYGDIIRYVVNRHFNSHITPATVEFKDMDSHFSVNNIRVSFSPTGVPSPGQLARKCFHRRSDYELARRYINDYTYSAFETRVNGEHSFTVYAPSRFRMKAVHPRYHYQDKRLSFTAGSLEKEVFMVELGSKHRVKVVPE